MNTENKPAENAQQTIEDAVKQESLLLSKDFEQDLQSAMVDVFKKHGYSFKESCVFLQTIPRKAGELDSEKPFANTSDYGVCTSGHIHDPMTMGYCLSKSGSSVQQIMKMLAYAHSVVDQVDLTIAQVQIIHDIKSVDAEFDAINEAIAEFVEGCFEYQKIETPKEEPVTKATNSGPIYDFDSKNIPMGGVSHPLNDDEASKGASISEPVAFDPLKDGAITAQATEEHSEDIPQCPPPTSENGL